MATMTSAGKVQAITLRCMRPQVFTAGETEGSQVWGRTVELRHGRRTLVRAASGTGKTSLCSFIMGERTDFEGSLLFDGRDTATLAADDWCALRRTSLAYLPQDLQLFPELTVLDNLRLKNALTGRYTEMEVTQMLQRLEVDHKAHTPAGLLSAGQQQRVALVRALLQPMDFLLLDEPVSHLDERNNRAAAALVQECLAADGASLIATSVGNPLLADYDETLDL